MFIFKFLRSILLIVVFSLFSYLVTASFFLINEFLSSFLLNHLSSLSDFCDRGYLSKALVPFLESCISNYDYFVFTISFCVTCYYAWFFIFLFSRLFIRSISFFFYHPVRVCRSTVWFLLFFPAIVIVFNVLFYLVFTLFYLFTDPGCGPYQFITSGIVDEHLDRVPNPPNSRSVTIMLKSPDTSLSGPGDISSDDLLSVPTEDEDKDKDPVDSIIIPSISPSTLPASTLTSHDDPSIFESRIFGIDGGIDLSSSSPPSPPSEVLVSTERLPINSSVIVTLPDPSLFERSFSQAPSFVPFLFNSLPATLYSSSFRPILPSRSSIATSSARFIAISILVSTFSPSYLSPPTCFIAATLCAGRY